MITWPIRDDRANVQKIHMTRILSYVTLVLLLTCCCTQTHAQFIKRVGEHVKNDADWRIRNKADQQVNKGLDSLLEAPKKAKDRKAAKKAAKKDTEEPTNNNTAEGGTKPAAQPAGQTAAGVTSGEDDMEPKDGYVTLKLSADKIFVGGGVTITGQSILYKNFKNVEITVTGPSTTAPRTITMDKDGKYAFSWTAPASTGIYTVTVTSSDKKAKQSRKVSVEAVDVLFAEDWPADNIRQLNKALTNVEKAVDRARPELSPGNKAALDQKVEDLKDKVTDVLRLYSDIRDANHQMFVLIGKGKALPPNFASNLSDLNNATTDQAKQMEQINEYVNHEPMDNSICEYLVMINEACAAFSTFTNFYSKSIGTILTNLALDKAVPKTVSVAEGAAGIGSPYDFPAKEAAKIYATSKLDAKSLTEKLGKAGLVGDFVQFTTDVLLKVYCGVFTGSFTHDYTIDYRNSAGETWWKYGADMKAAFNLRYPKKNGGGKIIKMKGNLEGNATRFSFFENIEIEDEFQAGSKGKIQVVPIQTFVPLAVPLSVAESDHMGFGATARGLATPAYFNIPVDAEYDVDSKKIRIFLAKSALIDFSELVATQFLFVMFGGDLLPYPKKMNFPIQKARTTIDAVVYNHNEYTVEKDAKGNESLSGKGSRHIGDQSSARETKLNFTITAKKD